ncbi:hypothetical protein H6G80_24190 [Nostoc sp. FACHB-87]|uniref:DUF6602 domain-containing protein n=1 Tax=Nostocaceae TaxID=1162 RepID=UPI00168454A9|nr:MULTISPECIES: DUF6602 domain-containing protein [Nostocaceae]MBD2457162.1 hypothetical protein [Nostoc sp. FACHB-87]MBD2476972.1 hypothetical protein [Anabaena sp. FACHB-83]
MSKPFVERFRQYLIDITQVMRGEASVSSIFPNTTDNGQSKERIFLEVLKHHIPSSCNIFLGGFLFNLDGDESKQMDIIISDYQSLKFDLLNKEGEGKSFACIDGTIGIVSVKSFLDKHKMFEALDNIASIPIGTALNPNNADPYVDMAGMSDGLLKVIFALDGASSDSTRGYIEEFYTQHPEIPLDRRPNYIHILGKYSLVRLIRPLNTDEGITMPKGTFCLREHDADLFFISSLITSIEKIGRLHRHIFYDYTKIFERAVPPANAKQDLRKSIKSKKKRTAKDTKL